MLNNTMLQSKEKLLAQKHTGFEDSSSYFISLSLPTSADFFFAETIFPDSETNEIVTLIVLNKGLAFRRPFVISI